MGMDACFAFEAIFLSLFMLWSDETRLRLAVGLMVSSWVPAPLRLTFESRLTERKNCYSPDLLVCVCCCGLSMPDLVKSPLTLILRFVVMRLRLATCELPPS